MWFGDDWKTQKPMGVAANISGVSFATAIAALSIGGIVMVLPKIPNIFRIKAMEEGLQRGLEQGLEQGREQGIREAIQAVKEKQPDETLDQVAERLRRERRS